MARRRNRASTHTIATAIVEFARGANATLARSRLDEATRGARRVHRGLGWDQDAKRYFARATWLRCIGNNWVPLCDRVATKI